MSDSSGHLDGPPPGPPDPPYIPGDLGAPSPEEFARRRAGDRHMSDNPYPNASNTMNYELHTAWDEGYAEGFAAGRAAADRNTEGVWPDQSAVHGVLLDQIKDAYAEGIADTIDRLRVRAAEMLPEVARFTLDEIEALAAADREKPDGCHAPHCWSEYGTPCGTCPVAAASPDERLREAATDT